MSCVIIFCVSFCSVCRHAQNMYCNHVYNNDVFTPFDSNTSSLCAVYNVGSCNVYGNNRY